MKGITVEIFRNKMFAGCTNGPSGKDIQGFTIVNIGTPIFEPSDEYPAAKLVDRFNGLRSEPYWVIEPIVKDATEQYTNLFMDGGNIADTSDSRFFPQYPVRIHDRYEPFDKYPEII